MKSKEFVIDAKKSFALIKMRKINLNFTKKPKIITITLGNLEEQFILFAI